LLVVLGEGIVGALIESIVGLIEHVVSLIALVRLTKDGIILGIRSGLTEDVVRRVTLLTCIYMKALLLLLPNMLFWP
jgi:hypothetical protein